jgi:hypothetical protein
MTLVPEARQYSSASPVFFWKAVLIASKASDSNDPYATTLPPSFLASSIRLALWLKAGGASRKKNKDSNDNINRNTAPTSLTFMQVLISNNNYNRSYFCVLDSAI